MNRIRNSASRPQARRSPAPGAQPGSPSGGLHPADKRRLIWFGVLVAVVIFALGTVGFAVFFAGTDDDPDAQGELATNPDAGQNPGQGTGQIAVGGEFVHAVPADAATFNPLFATDTTAQTAVNLLFPRLLGQDPITGLPTPTELATRWESSDDGLTYTFFLREGMTWRDGASVTAADFLYTYTALAQPTVQSPFQSRTQLIESMEASGAYTLVVRLRAPHCTALHTLRHPLLPSHSYAADFSDLATNPLNQSPQISAGPFVFASHTPDTEIVLTRNVDYWKGPAYLESYVLRVASAAQAAEGLTVARQEPGAVDLIAFDAYAAHGIAGEIADTVAAGESTGDAVRTVWHTVWQPQPGYAFLAANLADPRQPQAGQDTAGQDTAGQPVPQSPHPILGELAVRQALALAIDTTALLQIGGGNDERDYLLDGYLLPSMPWASDAQLDDAQADGTQAAALPAYDPVQAGELLDAAGWTLDANGLRSRDGMPLALRLMTNEDNPRRVALAQAIAQNLTQVGVQIRFEPLSFEEMTGEMLAQRFDLSLAGWDNLAPDPGLHPFWHSRDDVPERGFNFISFQDPAVDGWLDQALVLPGCAPDARGALYAQVQARVQEQLPYLVMIGESTSWAMRDEWQNLAPGPWQLHYNVQTWGRAE
ncbi:MAG: ABC transporter substrate-binding protein [Litorilinea sp.]